VLRQLKGFLRVALTIAIAYVAWVFIGRYTHPPRRVVQIDEGKGAREAEWERTYGGNSVKILQFYASESSATQGSKSLICYGVLNAKSVRIEPLRDVVSPSLNRCVEIAPTKDTRYTLTAEGNDGLTVSESFILGVKPDAETLPKITSFRVSKGRPDYAGNLVFSMEFSQQNGLEVSIDPPAFPTLHGTPSGSFYVKPSKTTTYTLTVTGKFGHRVQQQLLVEVPQL
jgi:hypothetical protein